MALLPSILQGSAACAAMIERVLTALLHHQVRRYRADLPGSFPPPKSRAIDRNLAAKRPESCEN